MSCFEKIPNKQSVEQVETTSEMWPELGEKFELNHFYKIYSHAEGWLGDSYLIIWTQREILEFKLSILEAYPEKYNFFASNGGGTLFGFFIKNDTITYFSAPEIGGEEDICILGTWEKLLSAIEANNYI